MTVCAVKGCHNNSEKHKKNCNITFHGFPSDPITAARWTEKIRLGRNVMFWKPTKNTRVCSIHFDKKDMYVTERGLCRIRKGAVPTKSLAFTEEELDNYNLREDRLDLHKLSASMSTQARTSASSDVMNKSEYLSTASSTCDGQYIVVSPVEDSLRRKLMKKTQLQKTHYRKIKSLQQKLKRFRQKKSGSATAVSQNISEPESGTESDSVGDDEGLCGEL